MYPEEPYFYNGLGLVNFSLGKLYESYQWFRKAIDISNKAEFHSNYVSFLVKLGRLSDALDYLE